VKKAKRWQDNDGDGKWYEPGVDVKKEEFADPFYKQVEYDDEDPRSMKTKWNLVKNRLRSLGLKMSHELEGDTLEESEAIREARRADKMGIPRKKVTYDKGEETRNPNPDRGAAPSFKPEGGSLAGSKAASRSRSLGDARRKANRKGANLAYGKREGRLATFAANKRDSDSDLGSQKAATDTGAHKDKQGFRQVHKYGERGDKRRPQQNPKHTANEEVVQEADSLSATVDRWEAARQKRMKQRQSYERPSWIPRDQDHSDSYGSSKGEKKKTPKKNANLQNDSYQIDHIDGSKTEIVDVVPNLHARKRGHQDWKSDLGSVFENANCCAKCGSYKHTTKECTVKEASTDYMRYGSSKTSHPTDKPIKEGGVQNKITINPVVNVESKVDEAIGTLTNADKVGNTPAWQNRNKLNKAGKPLYNLAPHLQANENEPEGDMVEAKVDAGKSPEEKEKVRNKRKFGVSHNVAGHGKLRRSLHRMNRGDKKIPGDKSKWMEMEDVNVKKSSPLDHSLEEKKSSSYDEPNWEKRKN
jgi:hypothetical protein